MSDSLCCSVAIVSRRVGLRWGGAENWTTRFALWLADRGYQVHIVTHEADLPVYSENLVIHKVPKRQRRQFSQHAQALVDQLQVDLVHDMGYLTRADLFHLHAGVPRGRMRRRIYCRFHRLNRVIQGALTCTPRFGRLDQLTQKQVSATESEFIAVSEMVAQDLRSKYGVHPSRIHVVHNGVDLTEFCPAYHPKENELRRSLGVCDTDFLILFVGNNFKLKGLAWLFRAIKRLQQKEKGWKLHVIGSGVSSFWKRLANVNCSTGSVTFQAHARDMQAYYRACDAFVLPSAYDSCSLTVLEALACGVPAITTRHNGVVELLQQGEAVGIIDDPRSVESLVEALRRLRYSSDPIRVRQLARQSVLECSLEHNFMQVERVYQQCLSKKFSQISDRVI